MARMRTTLPSVLQVGRVLRVGGWVKTGREAGAGAFAFLEVNDGSCFESIQVRVHACMSVSGSASGVHVQVKYEHVLVVNIKMSSMDGLGLWTSSLLSSISTSLLACRCCYFHMQAHMHKSNINTHAHARTHAHTLPTLHAGHAQQRGG